MRWSHLRPSEGRRMPWKNGGGTTLELAVDPPGGGLGTGFGWRLSSAEVGVSGPFSAFPGVERWLVLLEGAGLDLDFGSEGRQVLRHPLDWARFPGDWPAMATLPEGPVVDLNLMVDSRRWKADLQLRPLARPGRFGLAGDTTLVVPIAGTVWVEPLGLCLGRRHVLKVEAPGGNLDLAPGFGGALLGVVELTQVSGAG